MEKELLNNYLHHSINKHKEDIIKAFIYYYGLEYKDIIRNRINNTEFVFYINQKEKNNILKNLFTKKEKEADNRWEEINLSKKYISSILDFLNEKIVYSTVSNCSNYFLSYSNMAISKNYTCEKGLMLGNEYKRIVYINLNNSDDSTLIHELVHAVCDQELCSKEYSVLSKVGLAKTDDNFTNDIYLEEILTEMDAKNIISYLRSKNFNILDSIYNKKAYSCSYDSLLFLTKEFYEKYRDDIIYSRITLDDNYLSNKLGNKPFEEYKKTITDFFKLMPSGSDKLSFIYMKDFLLEEFENNYNRNIKTLTR